MKTLIAFILLLTLFFSVESHAQRVRKNYRELTASERKTFVDALRAAKARVGSDGLNVIQRYAVWNDRNWRAIHYNEMFLPWYRWFITNFEYELGATLPYWEWNYPSEQSTASGIWNSDFLGPFNQEWNLNRTLGTNSPGSWPTAATVSNLLAINSYTDFWNGLVEQAHKYPPLWVGGSMIQPNAPNDPSFYLHHAMLDRIWSQWNEKGNANSFSEGSMPTPYPFSPFPTSNPYEVSNLRNLRVWYADAGYVNLNKYYAKGGYELYRYTGTINAIDFFTVGSQANVEFVSANRVRLGKGFTASKGCTFHARIDNLSFNVPGARQEDASFDQSNNNVSLEDLILVMPNPSTGNFLVGVPPHLDYEYQVVDAMGNTIKKSESSSSDLLQLDLTGSASGIYLLQLKLSNGTNVVKRLSLQ